MCFALSRGDSAGPGVLVMDIGLMMSSNTVLSLLGLDLPPVEMVGVGGKAGKAAMEEEMGEAGGEEW